MTIEKNEELRLKREKKFKEKINKKHNNMYCLDKVYYTKRGCNVIIVCDKHGEVEANSDSLLRGGICPLCQKEITTEFRKKGTRKRTQEEWVNLCTEKHKGKYDYSETEFKLPREDGKVKIICPIHGEFWQTPQGHLIGQGCPKCARVMLKSINTMKIDTFIERAKKIHGDKYDYSEVCYINNHTKVCVKCSIHGEFYIRPLNHLHLKQGCPKCANIECLGNDMFINRANEIHNNKFDYSKVEYVNSYTKVCIICPIHGEFWQSPNHHLSKRGCPICNESKLEKEVNILLTENNIQFETQKKFKWLGKQSLDFFLPDYNIAIECQGRQHFIYDSNGWNTIEHLNKTQILDNEKMKLCLEHNIKLLYYSNLNIEYPYSVIEGKDNLLNEIKKY